MFTKNFTKFGLALVILLMMAGCDSLINPEDESQVDPRAPVVLNTVILEGPADGATLIYKSSPNIKWKGEVYPGFVAGFSWTLEKDGEIASHSDGFEMAMFTTLELLEEGSYIFSVQAIDDNGVIDSTESTINFDVAGADVLKPEVRFVTHPTDGSYRAPGSSIFFEWTASDASAFGGISGYSYRLSGTGSSITEWTSMSLVTTTAVFTDLQIGVYDFQVKATDNSGEESDVYDIAVTVKEPTILVVDDYISGNEPFLDEVSTDALVAEVLRDWSWEEWDVDELGIPNAGDLTNYSSVIWYVGDWPDSFYGFATGDYENPLDNFLDGGGNLWLMGSEILYATADGGDTLLFETGHFVRDYLHLTDGGDAGGDYTGLEAIPDNSTTADSAFTGIGIPGLATAGGLWPDELVPDDQARPIYYLSGVDDDGNSYSEAVSGVAYEGNDFNSIFWSINFAFLATNQNHLTLSPDDLYPVANHILGTIFEE